MSIMSQSIAKISPALLAAQKNMGDAVKDAKNPFFKSKFADLNAVREAIMPSLNANDITVLQLNVAGPEGRQFVRTLLLHVSGEFIGSDTQIVCAKPNDPQALGSAISYARRYGLQSMLCIGAVDDDAEKAQGRDSAVVTPVVAATKPAAKAAVKAASPTVTTPEAVVDTVKAAPPATKAKFARPPKSEPAPSIKQSGDMF